MVDNLVCLFRHILIQVFPCFIIPVDLICFFQCCGEIFFREQVYSFLSILYTAGRIDAGTYLKDNVTHVEFPVGQAAYIDDGFQSYAGVGIQLA